VEDYEHEARAGPQMVASSAGEVVELSWDTSTVEPCNGERDEKIEETRDDERDEKIEKVGNGGEGDEKMKEVRNGDEDEKMEEVRNGDEDEKMEEVRNGDEDEKIEEVCNNGEGDEKAGDALLETTTCPATTGRWADSDVVNFANSNVENGIEDSKEDDGLKSKSNSRYRFNSIIDEVIKCDADVQNDQQMAASGIGIVPSIDEDARQDSGGVLKDIEITENIVPSIVEVPQKKDQLDVSNTCTTGISAAEEVEVSSRNDYSKEKDPKTSEIVKNGGLHKVELMDAQDASVPSMTATPSIANGVSQDVQEGSVQENSIRIEKPVIKTPGSEQNGSLVESKPSTEETQVSSDFKESTVNTPDEEQVENSDLNLLATNQVSDALDLKDLSNANSELKISDNSAMSSSLRDSDRPATSAATASQIDRRQEDLGMLSSCGRTLWQKVTSLRPSYQSLLVLGVAVVAGVLYNVYFR